MVVWVSQEACVSKGNPARLILYGILMRTTFIRVQRVNYPGLASPNGGDGKETSLTINQSKHL